MIPAKLIGKSKTVWAGGIGFLVSMLAFAYGQEWVQQFPTVVTLLGALGSLLVIILRLVTDAPLMMLRNPKR